MNVHSQQSGKWKAVETPLWREADFWEVGQRSGYFFVGLSMAQVIGLKHGSTKGI